MSTITRIPWTVVPQRQNRAKNPAAATATTGYSAAASAGGGVVAVSQAAGGPGVGGVTTRAAATMTTAATGAAYMQIEYTDDIAAGTAHTFSAYIYRDGGATFQPFVIWLDAANVQVGAAYSPGIISLPAGAWQRVTFAQGLTAPAGAVKARIIARVSYAAGIPVGQRVLMASVLLETGAELLDFFCGLTPNTPTRQYTWTGTAHASTSVMSVPSAADQISPPIARAPYTAARESRTLVHTLLEQSTNLFTYRPPAPATGVLDLQFLNYAAALSARDFLVGNYAYAFESAPLGGPSVFRVAGGDLELVQDERITTSWHVLVPWAEATA